MTKFQLIPHPTLRIPVTGRNGENRLLMFTGSVVFSSRDHTWGYRGLPAGHRDEPLEIEIDVTNEHIIKWDPNIPSIVTLSQFGNKGSAINAQWGVTTRTDTTFNPTLHKIILRIDDLVVDDTDGYIIEVAYSTMLLAKVKEDASQVIEHPTREHFTNIAVDFA